MQPVWKGVSLKLRSDKIAEYSAGSLAVDGVPNPWTAFGMGWAKSFRSTFRECFLPISKTGCRPPPFITSSQTLDPITAWERNAKKSPNFWERVTPKPLGRLWTSCRSSGQAGSMAVGCGRRRWALPGWVLSWGGCCRSLAEEKRELPSARKLPQDSPWGWVVRRALTRLADLTFACFALPGVATRCQAHNTISTSVQLTLAAGLRCSGKC